MVRMNDSTAEMCHGGDTDWMIDCHGRLDAILLLTKTTANNTDDDHDNLLETISTKLSTNGNGCDTSHVAVLHKLVQEKESVAQTMHQSLLDEIATTRHRMAAASHAAASLSEQSQSLERQAQWIRGQIDATNASLATVQADTEHWRRVAHAAAAQIDATRQKQTRHIQRLQHQISLYASVTGIKWDYKAQEELTMQTGSCSVLAGEVNVISENTIKSFRIDREESSPFEVANQLWRLMNGQEESGISAVK